MPNVTDYTALLTGSYWNGIEITAHPVFVTYSFDAVAPASDLGNLSASAYATFAAFTAAQQVQARLALAEWSANSGVVFLEVAPGKGEINFAAYDFTTDPFAQFAGGMGFYPWGNWNYATSPYFATNLPGPGNILMNTAFGTGGTFAYVTVLHEIGHALGLKHPDEAWTNYGTIPATPHNMWDPAAPPPVSVMNQGATTLTHLAALDIAAIQAVYGTAADQGGMDTAWSWNAATATLTQHVSDVASISVRGIATNNIIYAGRGDDIISAIGAGTNTVYAGRGSDTLIGGLGTNYLFAGTGADTFIGTFGLTYVEYAKAAAAVGVNLASPWLNTGAAADDSFIDIHNLYGSKFADALTGDNQGDALFGLAGADTIAGGTGADIIDGGTGADQLAGGQGDDTYYVDNSADNVIEIAGAGSDTVFASVGYALPAGSAIEFLRAKPGSAGLALGGNELANAVTGGNGGDILSGGAGADTLSGGKGNDTLFGGAGADALTGGLGADFFSLAVLADSSVAAGGRDRITDFSTVAGDRIDLHLIDANSILAGDQAFDFIGMAAFSNLAGQLRGAPLGANTLVSGDVNGDGIADFAILVAGAHSFAATDFIL